MDGSIAKVGFVHVLRVLSVVEVKVSDPWQRNSYADWTTD
jgi:hypothetical protein